VDAEPGMGGGSNLVHFMNWLKEHRGLSFTTYADLWRWSVTDIEAFWARSGNTATCSRRRPTSGSWVAVKCPAQIGFPARV